MDARGITGSYSYDALSRTTAISFPDQTVSFSYDSGANGAGRLTGASDANHSMAWSYDATGRMVSATQVVSGLTRSVGYSYVNGNLSSITTPSGQTVTYGYAGGRVSSIAVNSVPVLSGVIYDPFGPVRRWMWANGSPSVRTYDQDGKLTQLDSGGESYEYSYDDAMRLSGLSNTNDPSLSWSLGYDSLDRLTSETSTARTRSWGYDTNGNRSTESGSLDGVSFSSTYTAAGTRNRLSSISGGHNNTYAYDAAGSVSSETDPGRAVSITTATTVSYLYNALGQRVWKSGPQAPTFFVYDQMGHLLGEYGTGGALIQETIWLEDMPVATLRPKAGGGVEIFYVHADHLGTPRKISRTSDNALVWRWDSDAFGKSLPNENPEGLGAFSYNLRFPGQYFDSESGLNYNYYRDGYDPSIGRYTQSDPIGLGGGINTYRYARSNPLSWADRSGLDVFVVINVNGSVIGTHAGLYVDTGGKVLYDPSGSYKVQEKGSGDALYEDEADLADYIHFQERDGPDVEVFYFPTTPEDDKQIIDRIMEIGGCGFAECTVCSSAAVRGIGPFKTLGAVRT